MTNPNNILVTNPDRDIVHVQARYNWSPVVSGEQDVHDIAPQSRWDAEATNMLGQRGASVSYWRAEEVEAAIKALRALHGDLPVQCNLTALDRPLVIKGLVEEWNG